MSVQGARCGKMVPPAPERGGDGPVDSAGIGGLRHAGPDSFHAGDFIRDLCAIRRHTESYPRNLRRAAGDLFRPRELGRDDGDARCGLVSVAIRAQMTATMTATSAEEGGTIQQSRMRLRL